RHGKAHTIPPHKVNYRANIWAMKELGVERIISPCAVGSLKENYAPGDFVFPDQYIDFTKKREYTFYDGGKTYHISTADPFCPELMELFYSNAKELNIKSHKEGTYICIEGPRFSTRAESRMFKTFGDIIGMTLVPEVQLARELEICYISVAMVTDYDVWDEKPVNVEQILNTLKENMRKSQELLKTVIPKIGEKRNCNCKKALEGSEV
ncbi:MAG: S-methyl-5'-thioadenosine phosphorylase, partial [Candidatus Thermoplasmatota archaeon]